MANPNRIYEHTRYVEVSPLDRAATTNRMCAAKGLPHDASTEERTRNRQANQRYHDLHGNPRPKYKTNRKSSRPLKQYSYSFAAKIKSTICGIFSDLSSPRSNGPDRLNLDISHPLRLANHPQAFSRPPRDLYSMDLVQDLNTVPKYKSNTTHHASLHRSMQPNISTGREFSSPSGSAPARPARPSVKQENTVVDFTKQYPCSNIKGRNVRSIVTSRQSVGDDDIRTDAPKFPGRKKSSKTLSNWIRGHQASPNNHTPLPGRDHVSLFTASCKLCGRRPELGNNFCPTCTSLGISNQNTPLPIAPVKPANIAQQAPLAPLKDTERRRKKETENEGIQLQALAYIHPAFRDEINQQKAQTHWSESCTNVTQHVKESSGQMKGKEEAKFISSATKHQDTSKAHGRALQPPFLQYDGSSSPSSIYSRETMMLGPGSRRDER